MKKSERMWLQTHDDKKDVLKRGESVRNGKSGD